MGLEPQSSAVSTWWKLSQSKSFPFYRNHLLPLSRARLLDDLSDTLFLCILGACDSLLALSLHGPLTILTLRLISYFRPIKKATPTRLNMSEPLGHWAAYWEKESLIFPIMKKLARGKGGSGCSQLASGVARRTELMPAAPCFEVLEEPEDKQPLWWCCRSGQIPFHLPFCTCLQFLEIMSRWILGLGWWGFHVKILVLGTPDVGHLFTK